MRFFILYLFLLSNTGGFDKNHTKHVLANDLQSSLKTEFECFEKEKKLVIKGDYIKFSSFTEDDGKLEKKCNDFEAQSVSVFATSEITIDKDFKPKTSSFELLVVAPNWTIVDSRIINLDGPQHLTLPEVKLDNGEGRKGRAGKSGNPGGSFIGIGDRFVNGQNLVISVNGGDGTKGQDGGDGRDGTNGEYPDKDFLDLDCYRPTCHRSDLGRKPVDLIYAKSNTGEYTDFVCDGTDISLAGLFGRECNFKVLGKEGKASTSGGGGGQGGKAGYPGHVLLIELSQKSNFLKKNSSGKPGEDGKGGKAGKPGSHGKDILYSVSSELFGAVSYTSKTYEVHRLPISNGVDGQDGGGDKSQAILSKNINKADIANAVISCKSYIRERVNITDDKDSRAQFYHKLDNNKEILKTYDALSFVNELRVLETDFQRHHKGQNFLPLYQSLLNRTGEFAKLPDGPSKKSMEQRKVLTYLYTSILGREYNLKDRSETNLIIDISTYLKKVQTSIKTHKKAAEVETMQTYRNNYIESIEKKTTEAKELIDNVILPEIQKAVEENNNNIDNLLNEIIQLQEATEKNIKDLAEKQSKLQGSLLASLALDMCDLLGGLAGKIPIVGGLATEIIQSSTNVARDQLGLNDEIKSKEISIEGLDNIPNIVNDMLGKDIFEVKNQIETQIRVLQQDYKKYKGDFKDYFKALEHLKSKLDKTRIAKDIYNVKKEMKDLFTKQFNKIKKSVKSSTALKKVYDTTTLVGGKLLSTFNNHNKKVEALAEVISQEEGKLKKLREYEQSVRNDIGPALESAFNNVLDTAKNLGDKSQAALDVVQYQIQSKIKAMNQAITKMTKNLKSSDSFANTFYKLENSFNTLIKLFQRIQSYQDQQNFANFVADINSAGSLKIQVKDPKLQEALNYLEVILSCNIVLQQYQTAVDAFKQYVFPLAIVFFEEVILPDYLDYGEDLDGLILKADTQINHIKKKLDEYRMTANRHDAYLGSGEFSSKYRASKPFFVWKRSQNKEAIYNLLSGKEVTVFAEIKKSNPRFDAIKFKEVYINFKATNDKLQAELNETLKDFVISATHLGNSYYRSNGKYYLITTGALEFWYTFETNEKGEPIQQSDTIRKVKHGDAMLSPYTTWKLKLRCDFEDDPKVFNRLQKYKDDIKVELNGFGHFLHNKKIDFDTEIDKFYTALDK